MFWELIVPDEELEMRDPNFVGPLSRNKVKRHQFYMHVKDRVNRRDFDWWQSDVSFIPLFEA
jgi:hypothetical protein